VTPHLTPRGTASVALMIALACASSLPAQKPPQGWAWKPVAPVLNPLRVLIIYDMEGLSGIDRQAMTSCKDLASYAAGQDRLADDVNAVVEGLVAAGVAKIEVIDRHGSGCDATPDLPASRLHPRATYVDETSGALFTRITQRQWDAVALVGAHASPGRNGFLEHLGSFGIERIINGVSVSESEQQGLAAGSGGIPIMFASGDDRLGAQLKERMPWVTFVEVKRATSRSSATRPSTSPMVAADSGSLVRALYFTPLQRNRGVRRRLLSRGAALLPECPRRKNGQRCHVREHEQVLVTGDEDVGAARDGRREDPGVRAIADFGMREDTRRFGHRGDVVEQRLDGRQRDGGHLELGLEDPAHLDSDHLTEHQLMPGEYQPENIDAQATGGESADQDVAVEEDPHETSRKTSSSVR